MQEFSRDTSCHSLIYTKLSGLPKLDPKSPSVVPLTPTLTDLVGCPNVLDEQSHNSQSWKKSTTCKINTLKDWAVQLESQLSFTFIKRVSCCYKYKFAVLSLFLFATWSFPLSVCPSSEICPSFTLLNSTRNIASIHKKGCDCKNFSSIWYQKSQSA